MPPYEVRFAGGAAETKQVGKDGKSGSVPVLIELVTADIQLEETKPLDVICVVDVSGSMSSICSPPDPTGENEMDNLSRLDLVKHSVKTVVSCLRPTDQFALVAFETNVFEKFALQEMNDAGKEKALAAVSGLTAGGGTQLWKGIRQGLDIAVKNAANGRTIALMVLTDGCPSDRGHMDELEQYLDTAGDAASRVTLSTFGFGYNLDSQLLNSLATRCGGGYMFIPDASFVGTAFVNSLSNLMVTMEHGIELLLSPTGGTQIISVPGIMDEDDLDGCTTATVKLGSAQYGQNRTVVVYVQSSKDEKSGLKVTVFGERSNVRATAEIASITELEPSYSTDAGMFRQMFLSAVSWSEDDQSIISNVKKESSKMIEAIEESHAFAASDPCLLPLLEDLRGQVTEATSRGDWFKKWGKHYLPSLCRSHALQQCSNFKDPGLQVYGGQAFREARDLADDVFVSLPPPEVTVQNCHGSSTVHRVDMHAYYNASGGCFDGQCLVQLADDSQKRVDELIRGDVVASCNNTSAKVVCITRTVRGSGTDLLCELPGGLLITPYHPIRLANREWIFPTDIAPVQLRKSSAVYNVVLDSGHIICINGVECVTLGHNFKAPVVTHSYFGSQLVVKDLQSFAGWADGLIDLEPNCFIRDLDTREVIGLRPPAIQQHLEKTTSMYTELVVSA